MTVKKALEIATKNDEFRRLMAKVSVIDGFGRALIFAIDGECFYFGNDGIDMCKGKHTAKRSRWLIEHERVFIVR